MAETVDVRWNGKVVGQLVNLRTDMFVIYGGWRPADSEDCKAFLEQIDQAGEVEVDVGFDHGRTTVCEQPDHHIEVRFFPNVG